MDWNEILEDIRKVERRIVEKFIEDLTENFLRTDLRSLITEDGAWNGFLETAELSSEEKAALRDALKESSAQKPSGENDRPERKPQKEQILQEVPQLKKKLEVHIRKLRELADKLDLVHNCCTISNVVSLTLSVASGVLELLDFVLSQIYGMPSRALSATSEGLGMASDMINITTTIVGESFRQSYESEARRLVGASINILYEIINITPMITVNLYTVKDLVEAFKTLTGQIRAIRTAISNSDLGAQARNPASTGRSSGQGVPQMISRARIRKIGLTVPFLEQDLRDLAQQLEDLKDGAKTESGGALRDLAHKLEENL
uniref:Apolipoprotein L 10A n=1 Tax=Mus spicilegus TaxID=10103 RepID=A0A8C6HMN9_MUSSI